MRVRLLYLLINVESRSCRGEGGLYTYTYMCMDIKMRSRWTEERTNGYMLRIGAEIWRNVFNGTFR